MDNTAGEVPEVLAQLESSRLRALLDKDFLLLDRLCHPNLRYTHSTGNTDDRDAYLDKCRSGFYVYDRIDYRLESAVIVGDTALFVEFMNADVEVDGAPRRVASKALAVWVRVAGEWQFVAYHALST